MGAPDIRGFLSDNFDCSDAPTHREANKRATAAVDAATSRRWCMSCNNFRPAEGGRERVVQGIRGRPGRTLWRCAHCIRRIEAAKRLLRAQRDPA